mgnify:CR=1 FL=1
MGIVNSGIVQVVVDYEWNKRWADHSLRWGEHAKRSIQMFKETGVKLKYWKGNHSGIIGLMRGEPFSFEKA